MCKLTSVEDALKQLLEITPLLRVEEVPLRDALGRVLVRDAISDIDVSPFDNSAMDGFAVISADLESASAQNPVLLEVVASIGAGDWCDSTLNAGQIARIMTGAPVLAGANAVVKVEDTSLLSGDGGIGSTVSFTTPTANASNIRRKAEEVCAGQVVISAGQLLGPAAIGLLAATGHPLASVFRRPRVAVVSTGSELVDAGVVPTRGQIRNSNSYSIAAQVAQAGGIAIDYPNIGDTYECTKAALLRASSECDFVITSGGVSVGDFDYVKPVLEEIGTMKYCAVNMRPGKPQTMGVIGGTPFFGLPGNPTSTYVGFEMFVRPALRKMQGFTALSRPITRARLTHQPRHKPGFRYFMRGVVTRGEDGRYLCEVKGNQSSALLKSAHEANCLIVLSERDDDITVGSEVDCIRLDIEEGVVI